MYPLTILLVDVNKDIGHQIASVSSPIHLNCISAKREDNLLPLIATLSPDIIVYASSKLPIEKTIQSIKSVRSKHIDVPIIFITEQSSESIVIAALKAGVDDYFKVPFSEKELIDSVLEKLGRLPMVKYRKHETKTSADDVDNVLIGSSLAMRKIKDFIPRVASLDCTVLITGETGTGKELVAELIHGCSSRRKEPLVKINCAALPDNLVESELFGYNRGAFTGAVAAKKGKFEFALGGTVFLDEIGDMTPFAQAKILRSIESKEVHRLGGNERITLDFRSIAATNKDPEELISGGRFREDLYYRLNVARLHLPPLRERREDIPELVNFGIKKLNRKFKCDIQSMKSEVMNLILRYDWPGNVRELMNVLEGTLINFPAKRIDAEDLPEHFRKMLSEPKNFPSDERKRILEALLETNWNKSTAAAKLNWSRMTLYRKIEKHNIVEKRSSKRR